MMNFHLSRIHLQYRGTVNSEGMLCIKINNSPSQFQLFLENINEDLQSICGDQQTFVQHWRFVQAQNQIDEKAIDRLIKSARRHQFRITGKANKFLNDLNAEIEQGWTGFGQTNRLLGRIAMRSYIFGHVLHTATPIEGDDLVRNIVEIAKSLPGYEDWCRHQHEIEKRAKEWARSIEQNLL